MTHYPNTDVIDTNPLLNGSYEVSDIASITAANFIGIMGSLVSLGTTGAATISRQAFTFGQIDVPGNPLSFLRMAWTTGATAGTPQFTHKIEDVATFAGKKVTFQGHYRSNAAMPIRLRQDFGTGGSPSSDVNVLPDNNIVNLPSTVDSSGTAQWRPFSVNFTLPSILGKSLGSTANTSYLAIDFLPNLNTIFQFDITMMRLVPGGQETPIPRRRPFYYEENLLTRYYSVESVFGTGAQVPQVTKRRMRATPSMTASAGTASNPTVDGAHLNHTVNVAVNLTFDSRLPN
jgi:hypothetical protein